MKLSDRILSKLRISKYTKQQLHTYSLFLGLLLWCSFILSLLYIVLPLSNSLKQGILLSSISTITSFLIGQFALMIFQAFSSEGERELSKDLSLPEFSDQMTVLLSNFETTSHIQRANTSIHYSKKYVPTFILYSRELREHWLLLQQIEKDLIDPNFTAEITKNLSSQPHRVRFTPDKDAKYLWYAAWEELYYLGVRATGHVIGDDEFGVLISQKISCIDIQKLKYARQIVFETYRYSFPLVKPMFVGKDR